MPPHVNSKSAVATVKLFPRLAPIRVLTTQVRVERPATRDRLAKIAATARQNDRTQVRARLLRMILDNERTRRHGERPNAS